MNELKLKQSFDKYFDAPIVVWKSFSDRCEEVKFGKNQTIKSTGQAEKNAYFILEGACGREFAFKGLIFSLCNYHLL